MAQSPQPWRQRGFGDRFHRLSQVLRFLVHQQITLAHRLAQLITMASTD